MFLLSDLAMNCCADRSADVKWHKASSFTILHSSDHHILFLLLRSENFLTTRVKNHILSFSGVMYFHHYKCKTHMCYQPDVIGISRHIDKPESKFQSSWNPSLKPVICHASWEIGTLDFMYTQNNNWITHTHSLRLFKTVFDNALL